MQDKNKPGLRFYAPSADAQLREAVLCAHECGVEWSRIDEVLKDNAADGPEEAIRLLDELKPTPPDDFDEMPTTPSLDEKREAWMRLNRAFK
jgi:hypothetical protein